MLFRATLIVVLLSTFFSVLAAPIDPGELRERLKEVSLFPRGSGLAHFGERALPFEERNNEDFHRLVARAPKVKLGSDPEVADVERGGKLGLAVKATIHMSKEMSRLPRQPKSQLPSSDNKGYSKRSKVGDKIKGFFKKAVGFVAKHFLKRSLASIESISDHDNNNNSGKEHWRRFE